MKNSAVSSSNEISVTAALCWGKYQKCFLYSCYNSFLGATTLFTIIIDLIVKAVKTQRAEFRTASSFEN